MIRLPSIGMSMARRLLGNRVDKIGVRIIDDYSV